MSVYRIYVEKKPDFAVEAAHLKSDILSVLNIRGLEGLRLLNRYDVEGIDRQVFEKKHPDYFSEPQVDFTYESLPTQPNDRVFGVEYLPGQYDQRADSCAQCIQLAEGCERPMVKNARIYILSGSISEEDFSRIKSYLINPVESREASLAAFTTLKMEYAVPTEVETLSGFTGLDETGLTQFLADYGLAMDLDDLKFCQQYFKTEQRDPTITEIRVIDTYWSDHCRHTTFLTNITDAKIDSPFIQKSFQRYLDLRQDLYASRPDKPMTLMDLAVIGAKALKKAGFLQDLDESEEINACSVRIKVDVNGEEQDWLLLFKNETHNHPTEIEPFGGAATCLGGAIRDPLSGRSYVYQAMRVTGAGDPLTPESETLPGKLSQRKITTTAAAGYSSYGNQIGLATGHVHEIYHPGYVAKRMEIGAVLGAAKAENVVRERPEPGDIVILLGGRTGRDGCGGATGSSKSHTMESLTHCGAEVQKGNAPEERKLQRLFRNPTVTKMIRRCNDFGAGGVCVAIGELADGLKINLDAVRKKYEGLDGTELAISESQERMAVVIRAKDEDAFVKAASEENLEAYKVAVVTEQPRMELNWNGKTIVSLSREFLNSNGAPKYTTVEVPAPSVSYPKSTLSLRNRFAQMADDLNICSQKGLVERFDSTIGAGSVTMPFAGKYQLTPTQAMAAKIPLIEGESNTASVMSWGFNPYISEQSPYHGAMYAVIESVAKIIAAGGDYHSCYLTFQEYFERTQNDPKRWGKPFAALLGALEAQLNLKIAAIGGKDSMSGTFEEIDVPPTLVSFAVSTTKADKVLSPEFKKAGSNVLLLRPRYDENGLPDFDSIHQVFRTVQELIAAGKALSVWALEGGGVAEGILKMALGNHIGFTFSQEIDEETLFTPCYGGFLLEVTEDTPITGILAGVTQSDYVLSVGSDKISLTSLQSCWEATLEPVFPCNIKTESKKVSPISFSSIGRVHPAVKVASPRVLIPVFPGTNCEYDTARAFRHAGAEPDIFVIRNLTASAIEESVQAFAKRLGQANIVAIPGGFSGGDEPDGSGKFITAFFRNPAIAEGVHELLKNRDGLMLGICNGFQALIKLGLVPYGEIREMDENCPTLTFNRIGRHQSKMVYTRVASNKSPWLMYTNVGEMHTIPISHGEGRFVLSEEMFVQLTENGQIATQYVDPLGDPTMDIRYNPNTSMYAIEGITSPDGRVFGKMGHSERIGSNICKNVPGEKDQKLFKAAVDYFKA